LTAAKKKLFEIQALLPEEWAEHLRLIDIESSDISLEQGEVSSSIGVGLSQDPQLMFQYVMKPGLRHICQVEGEFFEKELLTSARMIVDPKTYLDSPVSCLLDPCGCSEDLEKSLRGFEFQLQGSSQKDEAIARAREWLEGQTKSGSLISDVMAVIEELIMNAVYNAPFIGPDGKRQEVALDSPEVVNGVGKVATLFAGVQDKELVVGCKDEFGSLNLDRLLSKIEGCFEKGVAASMNMSSGGAGIGSYIILNAGTSYCVAVEPGVRTVVCSRIPLKMSGRKRSEQPKNIHIVKLI
jgi:hypothetical protein